jgi:hypothetical protein
MTVEEQARPIAACYDCGLPYSDPGFADLVVPAGFWALISPTGDEGGLLCPTCLVRAAAKADLQHVACEFRSGPLAPFGTKGPVFVEQAALASARRDALKKAAAVAWKSMGNSRALGARCPAGSFDHTLHHCTAAEAGDIALTIEALGTEE